MLFIRFVFIFSLFITTVYADELDKITDKSSFDFVNKKEPFLKIDAFGNDLEINPYGGIGYAFSGANYKNNAQNYGGAVPQMFHSAYMVVGAEINKNLMFEIGGMTGGTSYTNGGSADLNAVHFNIGWIFGDELLGEYGDKNKFIVLTGFVVGITNVTVGGVKVSDNYVSVAPELGLAYQRYIVDRISVRFDARVSSMKVYDSNGSIMGTFVSTILFHL